MSSSLKMGASVFDQHNNRGIMGEEDLDSISSFSDLSSVVSEDSDLLDEVTSSPPPSGALCDMSSLLQQLPFKRGLSKHFPGKSQSFTSLSNVKCLENLAKPENPFNKKLKSCKSYGGFLSESQSNLNAPKISTTPSSSRLISKKASKGSCSSLMNAKRETTNFMSNRPPIHPPHRSSSTNCFSNQTPLFA